MTTVVSPGAEARAGALGARAERARDWLAEQFAAPFSFDLFVLDEDKWADHAEIPLYGIPHAHPESGKIVLGSQAATLFDSVCAQFWPDFSVEARAAMHQVYGNPPVLEEFADLILVHELLHLVPRGKALPRMWHEELFANLGAVGYLASEEPGELPFYIRCRAGCEVPPAHVACSTLVDMANSFEQGGFPNYRRAEPGDGARPLDRRARRTDVAVSVPVASLLPVAVMHIPGVMFARVPVLVWVIVVVGAYVTVESPVAPLRISVTPLIWTSWPKAAFRANPPRPPADGDADGLEPPLAAAPPQAAMPSAAMPPMAPRRARFMTLLLPTG